MVEEYKKLRQRDANAMSKASWRITVRQLESLIRLSEAMAKMVCEEKVGPSKGTGQVSGETHVAGSLTPGPR